MGNSRRTILTAALAAIALLAAGAAFIWFSGGSGTPSATISAPTLDLSARETPAATEVATEEAAEEATEEATSEATVAAAAATTAPTTAPTEEVAAATALVVFDIVSAESEARFLLDEDLRGERITVIGTTDQVAGQIAVDFANPSASEVGVIRINMRTIATDNEFRNRAIRGQILQSAQDQFEFAEFTPTALSGMPDSVAFGEPFSFQITGDLKIRDVINEVTFDVTVTPASETRIAGAARAVITRESYGLTIPSVPGVANIEEEIEIELEFVATAG
jgi:polyisoprenoid-binding protein YceI